YERVLLGWWRTSDEAESLLVSAAKVDAGDVRRVETARLTRPSASGVDLQQSQLRFIEGHNGTYPAHVRPVELVEHRDHWGSRRHRLQCTDHIVQAQSERGGRPQLSRPQRLDLEAVRVRINRNCLNVFQPKQLPAVERDAIRQP